MFRCSQCLKYQLVPAVAIMHRKGKGRQWRLAQFCSNYCFTAFFKVRGKIQIKAVE